MRRRASMRAARFKSVAWPANPRMGGPVIIPQPFAMNITRILPAALGLALAVLATAPARAVVITENAPPGTTTVAGLVGQSFLVPGTAANNYNNITFNFFLTGTTTAAAPGTIYLLSQSYAGLPVNLSTLTPGYLANATGAGGVYTFAPSLTLTGGTTYYVYGDATFINPGLGGTTLNAYTDGTAYQSNGGYGVFSNVDLTFRLSGDRVNTPPPTNNAPDGGSAMLLLGMGLAGVASLRRAFRA